MNNFPSRKTRAKTIISKEQLRSLEKVFLENTKPNRDALENLVLVTGLSLRTVQVWFANRRSREKRRSMRTKIRTQAVKKLNDPANKSKLDNEETSFSQKETDGDISSFARMKRRSPVYPGERSCSIRTPQSFDNITNPFNWKNYPNLAYNQEGTYQPNNMWQMCMPGSHSIQPAQNLFENTDLQEQQAIAENPVPPQWYNNPLFYPPPPEAFIMDNLPTPLYSMNYNMYPFNNLDYSHYY